VRQLAAEALGNYGTVAVSAKSPLLKCLDDADPTVRGSAAWALVKVDPANAKGLPARVGEILRKNLSSEYWWLSKQSGEALKEIGTEPAK
jgi:HEAT repeat protein